MDEVIKDLLFKLDNKEQYKKLLNKFCVDFSNREQLYIVERFLVNINNYKEEETLIVLIDMFMCISQYIDFDNYYKNYINNSFLKSIKNISCPYVKNYLVFYFNLENLFINNSKEKSKAKCIKNIITNEKGLNISRLQKYIENIDCTDYSFYNIAKYLQEYFVNDDIRINHINYAISKLLELKKIKNKNILIFILFMYNQPFFLKKDMAKKNINKIITMLSFQKGVLCQKLLEKLLSEFYNNKINKHTCRKIVRCSEKDIYGLTYDKYYDIIYENKRFYIILNDYNCSYICDKHLFELIKEEAS